MSKFMCEKCKVGFCYAESDKMPDFCMRDCKVNPEWMPVPDDGKQVKSEDKKLPNWIFDYTYVYDHHVNEYAEIVVINPNAVTLKYCTGSLSGKSISRPCASFCAISRAEVVPFGNAQMINLVGKVVHFEMSNGGISHSLVIECANDIDDDLDTYCVALGKDRNWKDAYQLAKSFYIGNCMCCNFKHYDEKCGKWIEYENPCVKA